MFNENNNALSKEKLQELVKETKDTYTVPKDAFESYRIKRGLREKDGTGVLAGVSKIGNAHGYVVSEGEKVPDDGKLEYRGLDITKLIDGFVSENRYGFLPIAFSRYFIALPVSFVVCANFLYIALLSGFTESASE
jgi:citrate synthase